VGPVDLAHAAGAQQLQDLVGTESRARAQSQCANMIRGRRSSAAIC